MIRNSDIFRGRKVKQCYFGEELSVTVDNLIFFMPVQLNFQSKQTCVKLDEELYGLGLYKPQPPLKNWKRR